jgi:hypothetical protein
MDSKLRTMWMLGIFSILCLAWSTMKYSKDVAIADANAKAVPAGGAGVGGAPGGGGGGQGGRGGAGGQGQRRPQNLTAKVTVDQAIKAATGMTKGFVNSVALRPGQSGDVWMVHVVTKPGEGDIPGEGTTYLVDPTTGVATVAPARGGPGGRGPGGGGPGGGGLRGRSAATGGGPAAGADPPVGAK